MSDDTRAIPSWNVRLRTSPPLLWCGLGELDGLACINRSATHLGKGGLAISNDAIPTTWTLGKFVTCRWRADVRLGPTEPALPPYPVSGRDSGTHGHAHIDVLVFEFPPLADGS